MEPCVSDFEAQSRSKIFIRRARIVKRIVDEGVTIKRKGGDVEIGTKGIARLSKEQVDRTEGLPGGQIFM